jgi:predicted 2-oxoglutarate/Fe(II)-dependent dioxygenase YbiX
MKRYYEHLDVTHFIDYFTQEEYNEMYQELMMLCVDDMMLDAKEAGGATCPTGTMLRNNKGLPIETVMNDSVIINTFNKKMSLPYYEDVSHLINYYSDGHYYDYHKDKSDYTAITIFHKSPKNYSGGDLTFKDEYGILIPELKPRDLIVFPGSLSHSVTKMIGGNRISVSRFMK